MEDELVNASECCENGQLMACEDSVSETFIWFDASMLCAKVITTITNGITDTNQVLADASECCEAGELMACEDTVVTSFSWNEDSSECTQTTITTTDGV